MLGVEQQCTFLKGKGGPDRLIMITSKHTVNSPAFAEPLCLCAFFVSMTQ